MLPIDKKIKKISMGNSLFKKIKNRKIKKIMGNKIKKLIIEADNEVSKFLFCLLSCQFLSSLSF